MSNVTCDMLLHPELLSNEQLICVIQERHLKIPELTHMPRDMLLEIFHNFCVPYAQRRKDGNRNKNKTRKCDVSSSLLTKVDIVCSHQSKLLHICSDNLKPPPDILAGHMKRIKLNVDLQNKYSSENNAAHKRKIDMDINMDVLPIKRERKPITWP